MNFCVICNKASGVSTCCVDCEQKIAPFYQCDCGAKIKVELGCDAEMKKHLEKRCDFFQPVDCEFAKYGCWIRPAFEDIEKHREECATVHQDLLLAYIRKMDQQLDEILRIAMVDFCDSRAISEIKAKLKENRILHSQHALNKLTIEPEIINFSNLLTKLPPNYKHEKDWTFCFNCKQRKTK